MKKNEKKEKINLAKSKTKLSKKNINKDIDNQIVDKIYRKSTVANLDTKIKMLGETKLSLSNFLNSRSLCCILVFTILLYEASYSYIVAPFVTICLYYLIEYIYITYPLEKRVRKLDKEALEFFEILTLTLESGRNLENSLQITVDNVDSELSNEFRRTLMEIKFGKSLIEALEGMKKRMPSETINNIILNMTQTSIFGSNILETMNNQIEFLRDKQLLEIKEEINKLPNRISIISVLFIVPLILLLVLGPFLINFIG